MKEVTGQIVAWLQSVLNQLPARIRAIYVEYTDAYTPAMVHLICFNAFGFEMLANGRFDPSNSDYLADLGEFTWEPSDECRFPADDHPGTDWMAVLKSAAQSSEVTALAAERDIQFLIGEHDGDVIVIR